MVKVVADKLKFLSNENIDDDDYNQRGSGLLEILLSIGIVTLISPFVYSQISDTVRDIHDISIAKKITNSRGNALNFLRKNQDKWPEVAQIKLSESELDTITDMAHTGFIDKYWENGDLKIQIYLTFKIDDNLLHATKVAKNIGPDAAPAQDDHIAYGDYWAVSAPDFETGDVIYRIEFDLNSDDISQYLHRTTTDNDNFNVMERDLIMGNFDIFNTGTVSAESGKISDIYTAFVNSTKLFGNDIFFENGANINGDNSDIKNIKVSGDMTGFRNIYTKTLNDNKFYGAGKIIADSATINKSVNIANDLNIKSDSTTTIGGFTGLVTHGLYVPYLYTDELTFYNNFGITVSGELLQSTASPVSFGSWNFPNTTPPNFTDFKLARVSIPVTPDAKEFDKIISNGWKDK